MTRDRIAALGALLDVLCPMHLVLDAEGRIVHAGPTAQKVLGPAGLIGRGFLEQLRGETDAGVAGSPGDDADDEE